MKPRGVYLMGLRGSGKSRIGALLADLLGLRFVDLDALVAQVTGKSPADWLDLHGVAALRQAEVATLERLRPALERGGSVLALGGGTPEAPRAETILADLRRRCSWTGVWLIARPAVLRERVLGDGSSRRPRVAGRNLEEEIRVLLARRAPIYRRLSDLRWVNEGTDPEAAAAELAASLEQSGRGAGR